MLDMGAFPAIIPTKRRSDMVGGEVWEVSDGTLEVIDKLEGFFDEGNPRNLYNREEYETDVNGEVFVYVLNMEESNRFEYAVIEDGNWDGMMADNGGIL